MLREFDYVCLVCTPDTPRWETHLHLDWHHGRGKFEMSWRVCLTWGHRAIKESVGISNYGSLKEGQWRLCLDRLLSGELCQMPWVDDLAVRSLGKARSIETLTSPSGASTRRWPRQDGFCHIIREIPFLHEAKEHFFMLAWDDIVTSHYGLAGQIDSDVCKKPHLPCFDFDEAKFAHLNIIS